VPTHFNIVLVRVDNRLVHGQLLEAWIPRLGAECLIIANDEVAVDIFRETVIRMAVPKEIEVNIFGVEEFAKTHRFERGQGIKTIVLFSNITDALRAFQQGFRFIKLNVGNIFSDDSVLCCSRSVYLRQKDLDEIGVLIKEEVLVELRGLPKDKSLNFRELVKAGVS